LIADMAFWILALLDSHGGDCNRQRVRVCHLSDQLPHVTD